MQQIQCTAILINYKSEHLQCFGSVGWVGINPKILFWRPISTQSNYEKEDWLNQKLITVVATAADSKKSAKHRELLGIRTTKVN